MNVWAEVDRLTAPPLAAGPVRQLSREEIERLQAAGAVTPVNEIPEHHHLWSPSFRIWRRA